MKYKIQCLSGILFAILIGILVAILIAVIVITAKAEETSPSVAYNNGNFQRALRIYQNFANNGDLEGWQNLKPFTKE